MFRAPLPPLSAVRHDHGGSHQPAAVTDQTTKGPTGQTHAERFRAHVQYDDRATPGNATITAATTLRQHAEDKGVDIHIIRRNTKGNMTTLTAS